MPYGIKTISATTGYLIEIDGLFIKTPQQIEAMLDQIIALNAATAQTATEKTALLNVFTSTLKGLAPASGGGTSTFLRADGTWAAAGTLCSESVKAYGAVGDGTTDDTASVTAAYTAALTSGFPVYFPPGNYKLVSQGGSPPKCVSVTAPSGLKFYGEKGRSIITFDSSLSVGFRINAGSTRVSFDGLRFEGYAGSGYDDFHTNAYAAVHVLAGSTDVEITNCYFNKTQAMFFASNDAQGNSSSRLHFERNHCQDSPVSLAGCANFSTIVHNKFFNTSPNVLQSHAIYVFGTVEYIRIFGNEFQGHADSTIDFRGISSCRQSKQNIIVTHNCFTNETSYATYWSTQGSRNHIGTVIWAHNIHENAGGVFMGGVRNAIVDSNMIVWDYRNNPANINNTGVTLFALLDSSAQCVPTNNKVTNNTIINQHPFFGVIDITTLPVANDTVTVGAQVYTWKATASASGEVTIGVDKKTCAQNLAHEIQGRRVTPTNIILRDLTDVWNTDLPGDTSQANEAKCWVASYATFALSASSVRTTITTVADMTVSMLSGIACSNTDTTLVQGNTTIGRANTLADNINITYKGNITSCSGNTGDPSGLKSSGNVFAEFDGNRQLWDRSYYAPQQTMDSLLMSYDAFPVIRNTQMPVIQKYNSNTVMLPWLQGASGWVPTGDGKAKQYLWYGNDAGGSPAAAQFSWTDGMAVHLYNANTTTLYTFTFKRTTPNGTTEFNTYATLLALINTQTAGSWTAVNPVLAYGGVDTYGWGYIEITAGAVGTIRNQDYLECFPDATGAGTNRGSRTCCVYLRPLVATGYYPGFTKTPFSGGAAAATKTVIYSPIASDNLPCQVSGLDAASHALDPVCYVADTIPGVCYVITHAAGSGTFSYRIG